ncbi:MAG: SDR family NAD(P)-dependent oxidoreductase [Pirellulales bacterium]|nr:SDR family NAD(P)-dependent oxidoreductase [Pirellulales bacterium]
MTQLAGKRVLITGAAQGIGRATALVLARRGCDVVLTDVREDLLAATAAELRTQVTYNAPKRPSISAYPLDVTDEAAILALRDEVHHTHGPIDILVNNAGLVFGGTFLDVPLARHRTTYEVNTLGLVAMTHAFLPDLISRPAGHLVNIASASAYIGLPYGTTYASSKWAVLGFSDGIRLELAELGQRHVRVTAVCPSFVNTGLFAGATAIRQTTFLETDSLAEKIVRAIERDKIYLLAPRLAYITPVLRGILPTRLFDAVGRWFGVTTSMRHWQGRGHSAATPSPASTADRPLATSSR